MPIYEYRCSSCGTQKDILQKLSDAPLTTCPECGKETFSKQLTAASFQLKGSGWYATDFKGGSKGPDVKPDIKPDTVSASTPAAAPSTSTASASTTGDSV